MAEHTLGSEFYWENIMFIKVEDKVFSVPRYEFLRSSEVFAGMFLLPSGPTAFSEGLDREHPIFLEGYKKDEFVCLMKVMYPTAGALISDTKLDLSLEKSEWVSVLKLSTMWDMEKIRKYAIHKLSTETSLSPTEKILLARAHKVPAWLEEGVTSLVGEGPEAGPEDLATLGWETAARILWIQNHLNRTLRFRRDEIKCGNCSCILDFLAACHSCKSWVVREAELTFPGSGLAWCLGTGDHLIPLMGIRCKCGQAPFNATNFTCNTCKHIIYSHGNVRITPNDAPQERKELVMKMFGVEINGY